MKKVITYGTYDLFHQGHYNLLKRAKELGDYLIVGVTTDNFDLERGKLNVCNNLMERIESIRATGLADQIIIEEYIGQKIDDIQRYGVDVFAIGSDWTGKFDYLNEYCKVVYLPRTEGISSTLIRAGRNMIKLGVIGTGNIAARFVRDAGFVATATVESAYNSNATHCRIFCLEHGIETSTDSFDHFLETIDAAYIASPHLTHYDYAKRLIQAGKHVLCETPFVFTAAQARELFDIAQEKGVTLMIALKTAFFPAFGHLISLIKSGRIGEVVEVSASVTSLLDQGSRKLDVKQAGGSMSENSCFPLLAIFRILGTNYIDTTFYSKMKYDTDIFTKGVIQYAGAIATFGVGLGVKSEGNLIIGGTRGNVYVPAPWWKPDFFELRYEDPTQNKKYFYPYEGEGLCYELKEFISAIVTGSNPYIKLSKDEIIAMAKIQETFANHHINLL